MAALVLRTVAFVVLVVTVSTSLGPTGRARAESEHESIFDGKTFSGWRHTDSHWTIAYGSIVGEIPAGEILRQNLFLFWEGEVHDFDLRLEFRVTGDPSANSGVQFRSQILPDGGAAGYQADIDDGATWLGRIYDEHGRALIGERGTEVSIDASGNARRVTFRDPAAYRSIARRGQWNDFRVRAVGSRIETFVNGELACALSDDEPAARDLFGKLALQLHSGPGPARIEFRRLRLRQLGRTEASDLPVAPTTFERPERRGELPRGADGTPLDLGFESGSLAGWTVKGEAWKGQPIRGDTVTPRRPGQASEHDGEHWIGGYELEGDAPTGRLESAPFAVTHPFASFLVGGGRQASTRVEIVDAASGEVIHTASGEERENLGVELVRLDAHIGRLVAVHVIDESSGPWGHINFDDFRFHAEIPDALRDSGLPRRLRVNPLLRHLVPNPRAARGVRDGAERTLGEMYVPEGFEVELIAAEPRVRQPIAFAFDARGRLWVAEAFSYPQRRPEGQGEDRIVILSDDDGDGVFENHRVFIEGLNLVSGLEIGYGGVWVGAAPELLFLPDADRDDVPDGPARILLDGWGLQDTHETLNNFTWGPDGWLYGVQGVFNTSLVGPPGTPEARRVELNACVWRYHPIRHEFEVFARGGSNQWGLDFDARGALFMTHCRSFWGGGPTTHVALRGHYWNQANSRHAPFVSGDHPPGLPHLRNFLRASARYGHGEGGAGQPGSSELYGGHSHVGTMIYLGDNWPSEYRDHLFTHNLHGHQINHQVNERRGSGYDTIHGGTDVLWVADPRYIAVDLAYGPDGAVYISDWYDTQHCHSPHMERWDRSNGRIYRMSWTSTWKPRRVDLVAASDLELARHQSHPNDWYPRTARRLLAERASTRELDPASISELRSLLGSSDPLLVLRGEWTLHAVGALPNAARDELLGHDDEHVRAWTIRLATERRAGDRALSERIVEMARKDGSALVRLAMASFIADAPSDDAWRLAEALALHEEDAEDANLSRMIWYGIAPRVETGLERAFALAASTKLPDLRDFILWYASKSDMGIARVVAALAGEDAVGRRRLLELALFARRGARGLVEPSAWESIARELLENADPRVVRLAEELGALFGDERVRARLRDRLRVETNGLEVRREAFGTLARLGDTPSLSIFLDLLDDARFRGDVLGLLARFSDERIPRLLIDRFEGLSAEEQRSAIGALVARAPFARALLGAILDGKIAKRHLSSFWIRQLRSLRDPDVDALVERVWGPARDTSEDSRARIAAWAKTFGEAPLWAYDEAAGREVFDKTCGNCHAVNGKGGGLGPDLAGSGQSGVDYFLESILDPSAVVGEDFRLTTVVTRSGDVISGLARDENNEGLTLRTVTETRVISRADIASRETAEVSFMPEGLFDTLSERQVIELLKHLTSLR
jgi:putative membrane-bound dehydrogenase-like protein